MVKVSVNWLKPPPGAGFATTDSTVGPSVRGRTRTPNVGLFWIVLPDVRSDAVGLEGDANRKTPEPLGMDPLPVASVPIRLPSTTVPAAFGPRTLTAVDRLPEMRFPSPVPLPPTLLLGASLMKTPCWLGSAAVPAALVPILLPNTLLFEAGPTRPRVTVGSLTVWVLMIWIPAEELPEMTLPRPGPPIRLFDEPRMRIPWKLG